MLPSAHELTLELDIRVEGSLLFRMGMGVGVAVSMPTAGLIEEVSLDIAKPLSMHVWPQTLAPLQVRPLEPFAAQADRCQRTVRVLALPLKPAAAQEEPERASGRCAQRFLAWLSHAGCVLKYSTQRLGPKLPARPRRMHQHIDQLADGVVIVETRHRPAAAPEGAEEEVAAKQLSWSELDSAQVETAMRLGCGSAEAWDGGVAVIWLKSWDDLTPTEVAAATELGFDEWNWNEEDAADSRQSAFCMDFPVRPTPKESGWRSKLSGCWDCRTTTRTWQSSSRCRRSSSASTRGGCGITPRAACSQSSGRACPTTSSGSASSRTDASVPTVLSPYSPSC